MAKTSFKLEHPLENFLSYGDRYTFSFHFHCLLLFSILCMSERRQAESSRIREKYPERVPVIVEKAERSDIPDIDKKKLCMDDDGFACTYLSLGIVIDFHGFEYVDLDVGRLAMQYLVPADLTVGQFVYVVRKRIKLSAEKAIFVFVKNTLPPTAALMSAIYEENKDEDGFLYMTYSGENTFGSLELQ
ncbi:hypothetical protein RJ639_027033 [Escallonia herrerae]|uniref:Autophagy-related protein n=1 Tax=Escallonia herrerae TaxID=1293975 RepID=A0AA89BKA3_9ASTE|nr:hypothetical protein RJ639_027033 [Escallonia herrerae]